VSDDPVTVVEDSLASTVAPSSVESAPTDSIEPAVQEIREGITRIIDLLTAQHEPPTPTAVQDVAPVSRPWTHRGFGK
jgi:hypothetical protein